MAKIAGHEVSLGMVVKVATGLAALVGIVMSVNSYFATASDVSAGFNATEQAMTEMRLDILRDRKYSEMSRDDANRVQVQRYKDQIQRLEDRQDLLQKQQLERSKGWW